MAVLPTANTHNPRGLAPGGLGFPAHIYTSRRLLCRVSNSPTQICFSRQHKCLFCLVVGESYHSLIFVRFLSWSFFSIYPPCVNIDDARFNFLLVLTLSTCSHQASLWEKKSSSAFVFRFGDLTPCSVNPSRYACQGTQKISFTTQKISFTGKLTQHIKHVDDMHNKTCMPAGQTSRANYASSCRRSMA